MKNTDYHKTISAKITPEEAFTYITDVSHWWTSHFKGKTSRLNDTFNLTFGENTFSFKVIESIPGEKLVWLVTDCNMPWLTDKKEWKGTNLVWNIAKKTDKTTITFTHIGLVPEVECYDICNIGWNNYIGKSLPSLIETGKGILFDD